MNRRGFLSRLGFGVVAASAVAATGTAPISDRFVYRGFDVKWTGWREPTNQTIVLGLWIAVRLPAERQRRLYAASTLGVVDDYGEMDCVDCTRLKDWPVITPLSSEADRDAVKARACRALLARLDVDA